MNSWQQFLQWKHIRSHQRRDPNMWVTTPVLTSSSTSSLNSLPFTWIPLHLVVLSNSCRHVLGSDERIRKYQHHRGWHAQKHHGILVLNVLTAAIVFSWFLHLSLCSTDSQCHLYAATNSDITVPLGITVPNSGRLEWNKDGTTIFRRRGDKVSPGVKEDVASDGSLKLKKVSKDKAGTYTPEVYTADGKAVGGMKSTKLCVIGRFLFICFSLSAVPGSETKVYISPLLWAWNITNYF